MALPPRFLDELRARIPLAALIGRRVKLARAGRQWKGCCPFHHEKSPSFYVYDDHYHCFGCGEHGDAIAFVMRSQGAGFSEAVAALAAGLVLGRTTFGRATYALGANEGAARFSGVAVDRTKLLIYTASGVAAGLAAVIFVSRVSTTRSDMGTGLELDVITAVVLGGTSIFGGRGTVAGTVLGLVLIQALRNGLALAGVKGDGTIVVIGAVLILAILVSNLLGRDGDG
jgi:ABC-type glucose/galactose transport system permease subunit